jgi:glycosyltransferase involved in cell wall biosynthesis
METENNSTIIFQKDDGREAEVTVIITLYNYENMVEETLDSVFHQTLRPLNLVIVDDHSNDNSLVVAEQWMCNHAGRFNQMKLVHHLKNQGLGKTRNTAFRHADTPFVFVLDADNIIYPNALEKLLKGLKNTSASFAYSYLEHFGDVSKVGGLKQWEPRQLQFGNTIDAMVLMRKSAWEKASGYSEDMPYNGWEDYELWFKIAEFGGWGVRLPEILCRYRVHLDSMLHSETNKKVDQLQEYLRKKHKSYFAQRQQ